MNLKEFIIDPQTSKLLLDGANCSNQATETLRKLERLDLLSDEAVFNLIAQAPIDPIGLYGMCKHFEDWVFQSEDFTVTKILAKKGDDIAATMTIDLLSNRLLFLARQNGALLPVKVYEPDEILQNFKDISKDKVNQSFYDWVKEEISKAIKVGQS